MSGDTKIDISSEGAFHLKKAIELALVYHTGPFAGQKKEPGCTHWMALDGGIWFAWGAPQNTKLLQLPAAMGIDSLTSLSLGWLKENGEYGEEPDCDGTVSRGWRLLSHWENMPDCSDRFYLSFGVLPAWMEYHK